VRNLEFDPAALDDLAWWVQRDRKLALRIIRLVQETIKCSRTRFEYWRAVITTRFVSSGRSEWLEVRFLDWQE